MSSAAAIGPRTGSCPIACAALQKRQPILVRNPQATRPWQHVLEPLSGYLWLAASLANPKLRRAELSALASAFNFGPDRESNRTVEELVLEVLLTLARKLGRQERSQCAA